MLRNIALLFLVLSLAFSVAAATKGPDKELGQRVCDAWNTLDVNNAKQYYDLTSNNAYFDIAPLKYSSWKDYETGVVDILKKHKALKMTVNDDFKAHTHGKLSWSTATLHLDGTDINDKPLSADLRWTAIWENKGGKWLITHEHVSAPMQ